MTAHDVQLTDLVMKANVLHEEPKLKSAAVPVRREASTPDSSPYRRRFKRIMDITLILMASPVVVPLIGVLALVIAMTGGQPFYSQQRIGMHGRSYRIWKLRTMVRNADAVLEEHLSNDPAMRAEWNSKQKLLKDPRVTRLGQILRKCSIDELPQLWNVIRGEMSLVGPRPMMVQQKKLYVGEDYYSLRPGVTGLWQISDRNGTTFADRAHYDARYNASLSFKTDLQILLATVRVVLRGTGH